MPLIYQDAYFVDGPTPKHWVGRYGLKNVPLSGFTRVLVWWKDDDSRFCTVLHPFTLYAAATTRDAAELTRMKVHEMPADMAERIQHKFRALQGLGMNASYDEAAKALTLLGAAVPTNVVSEDQRERRVGGKPPLAEMGKKLRIGSKRCRVAEFFDKERPQSIRECMADMDMSRNSVLSALFMLNKDTGVGYEVSGDTARLVVPKGWVIYEF